MDMLLYALVFDFLSLLTWLFYYLELYCFTYFFRGFFGLAFFHGLTSFFHGLTYFFSGFDLLSFLA